MKKEQEVTKNRVHPTEADSKQASKTIEQGDDEDNVPTANDDLSQENF